VRILKDLFAPKWCKIRGVTDLRIPKDLAEERSGRKRKKRQLSAAWSQVYTEGIISDSMGFVKRKMKGVQPL
jgi:hypothetical protein